MRRFRFGILAVLALCWTAAVSGHDLQTEIRQAPPYVVVKATYEGTEPASFIEVTVYPPGSANVQADAFQAGRTDYNGEFVFLPSAPGEWRITLDDEMGHRTEIVATVASVEAASPPMAGQGESEGRSTSDRLIIGLSVLFGAAGLLYGWLARRKQAERV